MKQTITIDIDVRDGYELKFNPETRTVEEVKKEPIRSKSWEEFCNNHEVTEEEYYISSNSQIIKCKEDHRHSYDTNNLGSKEDAEGILALIQLTRLHDEWVGDWEPDWSDFYNSKYAIYPYAKQIQVVCVTTSYNLLSFPTKEMAEEFLGYFGDLIEKAKKFI